MANAAANIEPTLWPAGFDFAIFDFDGTLSATEQLWEEVDRAFFSQRGIAYTADVHQTLATLGFTGGAAWVREAFGVRDSIEDICDECGVLAAKVISVCGHDTQSAITAVPCKGGDFAFLSSGTWSLFGTELEAPIVNEKSLAMNVTNEGGYGGSVGFLKNIIGLWLMRAAAIGTETAAIIPTPTLRSSPSPRSLSSASSTPTPPNSSRTAISRAG